MNKVHTQVTDVTLMDDESIIDAISMCVTFLIVLKFKSIRFNYQEIVSKRNQFVIS